MARGGETNCNGKIFSGGFSGVGGGGCRDDSGGRIDPGISLLLLLLLQ